MTVISQCACGKTFYFPDNWADKTIFCRFCGAEVALGAPDNEVILPGASDHYLADGYFSQQWSGTGIRILGEREQSSDQQSTEENEDYPLENFGDSETVSEKPETVVFEEESSPMILEPVEEETGTSETSATEDTGSVDLTLEPD